MEPPTPIDCRSRFPASPCRWREAAQATPSTACDAFRVRSGDQVNKGRLEAFSDGVFAIIITIMVLDLKVPAAPSLDALRSTLPLF